MKYIVSIISMMAILSACASGNSNHKQQLSPKEQAMAKKARIQTRLDTTITTELVGNIKFLMNSFEYEEAVLQLKNETNQIRIADAQFYVSKFESMFNEKNQLVALGLITTGRYQTIGEYIDGLDDNLSSVEDYLHVRYGNPDSTSRVNQANHIPRQEFKEWIFNQRVIVQTIDYSDGEYKGTFNEGYVKGKVFEGDVVFELWYYYPPYYLNEKSEKERLKQEEIDMRNKEVERERSYSTNL